MEGDSRGHPHGIVLRVTALRKRYGATTAVDGVAFSVGRGEIVGLVGPNGAGKTSIINMILGVLLPDAGRIEVAGLDVLTERSRALECTGFAAVYAPLPGNLTVIQNLRVYGLLYGVRDLTQRSEVLLHQFGLERFRHTRCGVLSSGEQTRVGLAKAMLNRPELLLLDEPTASLDPYPDPRIRRAGGVRHSVDIAQYVRSRGGLRPCAVPVPRPDPARGESPVPATRARQGQPRGVVPRRGPGAACRGGRLSA